MQKQRPTQTIEQGIPTVGGLVALRGDRPPAPLVAVAPPTPLNQAQPRAPDPAAATTIAPASPNQPPASAPPPSVAPIPSVGRTQSPAINSVAGALPARTTSGASRVAPLSAPRSSPVLTATAGSQPAPPPAPPPAPAPSSTPHSTQTVTPQRVPTPTSTQSPTAPPRPSPISGTAGSQISPQANPITSSASPSLPALQNTQANTRITSSVKLEEIPHLEGILYCLESMPLPPSMTEEWCRKGGLKSAIDDELLKISTNHEIFADLVMASSSNDRAHLKPSVVVTCGSKKDRDEIKGRLQPFIGHKIVNRKYKLRILIDKDAGSKADVLPQWFQSDFSRPTTPFGSLGPSSDPRRPPEVSLPPQSSFLLISQPDSAFERGPLEQPNELSLSTHTTAELMFELRSSKESPSTFCGLRITRWERSSSIDATFGGIIYVDGRLLGLTIGHLFASIFPSASVSFPSESDEGPASSDHKVLYDSSSGDSILPPTTTTLSSAGRPGLPNPSSDPKVYPEPQEASTSSVRSPTESKLYITSGYGVAGALAGTYFVSSSFKKAASIKYHRQDCMDWALLELHETDRMPANNCPGRENVPIDNSAMEKDLTPGPVTLITSKSGVLTGYLSEAPSSMTLKGHQYDVRRIGLSKTLERGDSGAWVVRDRKLCGMVIAGGGLLPWAYMLPIEKLFAEIKMLLGAQEVKVPTANEIASIHKEKFATRRQPRPTVPRLPETKLSSAGSGRPLQQIDDNITPHSQGLQGAMESSETEPTYLDLDFELDLPTSIIDPSLLSSLLPTFVTGEDSFPRTEMPPERPIMSSDAKEVWAMLYRELFPKARLAVEPRIVGRLPTRWTEQRPLHTQTMLGHSIVITEDPNMHMVFHESKLFMKPLPLYVTHWKRWLRWYYMSDTNTDPRQICRGALAILWSYIATVRYPSDLRIAVEIGLLPNLPWEGWRRFALQMLKQERQVLGEIEETNLLSVVTLDELCDAESTTVPYRRGIEGYYTAHRQRMMSTPPLLHQDGAKNPEPPSSKNLKGLKNVFSALSTIIHTIFAMIILCLLAFLTGLNGDILSTNAGFQRASYGFVIFCLVTGAVFIFLAIYCALPLAIMASKAILSSPRADFWRAMITATSPERDMKKVDEEEKV